MNADCLKEYCTGCGLCGSICGTRFTEDKKGFPEPVFQNEEIQLLERVCPAAGYASERFGGIWGNYISCFYSWSEDEEIRQGASSGGSITALCCYLLKNHLVDGIIQTRKSDKTPFGTVTVISRTEEDVKKCMGSRYSISSPLLKIRQIIKPDETYAFVGKPCDVSALRIYMEKNADMERQIIYLFSFFCAGMPSNDAQKILLKNLDCSDINECIDLQYRGNGWPGYATALKKDGSVKQITYIESWGRILGRDVRKCCRFCLDGIGELADISCGDAWYLTKDKKPDFTENDGRNVVFVRSQKGLNLIREAEKENSIFVEKLDESICEELKYIQTYQYERRAGMGSMIAALKICSRNAPSYSKSTLNKYKKELSVKKRVKRYLGTIKRVKQGKI